MMQAIPVEQWLTELPFLTDTSYPRDFVTIIREQGTTVTLDCLQAGRGDGRWDGLGDLVRVSGRVELGCPVGAADRPAGVAHAMAPPAWFT